ncbi:pancreatic secretory granule membrane major glycoprotein GP2-like isoform X2 [Hyperolius riggenbachi]|uniref:pancreatic secretory granule membrane major glycoprotein GP2-like isoform X2 n=1 Tax=Hyperolius riggenbachi TaxID=752182 RepID=UPI0035A2E061
MGRAVTKMLDFFGACVVLFGAALVTRATPDIIFEEGIPESRGYYQGQNGLQTTPSPACTSKCQNGGMCTQVKGQYQCLCKPGFMGQQCQDMQLELMCDRSGMRLQVLSSILMELNVNSSTLRTLSQKCGVQRSPDGQVSITLTPQNHTLCGTIVKVNGTHLIYSNELSTHHPSEKPEFISRSVDLRIAFSCFYRYDRVVSLLYPLLTSASVVTFVTKEGELNVTMSLYPTADFLDPYDHPPVIPITDRLYIQLQILGDGLQEYFTLKLEECWATPVANPGNRIRHKIIFDGLAYDSTVEILQSEDHLLSRFSMQMFRFVKFPELYVHCRIRVCRSNTSHSCEQPRATRDLSDPYRKIVSFGPVRLIKRSVSSIGSPESGLTVIILPASFAAALIFLLLGLVSIAKIVNKRAKQNHISAVCPHHLRL